MTDMKRLYVYADFNWLPLPQLIGELSYEYLRGSDSYSFEFDKEWLRNHGSVYLGDDLNNYPGKQYTQPDKDIFGCFADAMPDRWGRMLLNRREQILAREEQRTARVLKSFDYLSGIDDFSRMGGFRFKENKDDDNFINSDDTLRIPPITDIRILARSSEEIEKSEEQNLLPEKKWLQQLVHPGTSLGGARPKAGIIDESGALCVAKFPSRNDDYDVALWEHFCHLLAKEAGIFSAETKAISLGEKHHTLLSRRFDRTVDGKRIHFASSMTLLGLTDGCGWRDGYGYLDIVDFIIRHCCDVENNLQQLFRRVAFNIAIRNTDDHFRNHGFLLTPRGWVLSPAYDMNPTTNNYQSLLIDGSSNESNLNLLLSAAEEYMLPYKTAKSIISEVVESVHSWKHIATQLCIPKREIALFERVFEAENLR